MGVECTAEDSKLVLFHLLFMYYIGDLPEASDVLAATSKIKVSVPCSNCVVIKGMSVVAENIAWSSLKGFKEVMNQSLALPTISEKNIFPWKSVPIHLLRISFLLPEFMNEQISMQILYLNHCSISLRMTWLFKDSLTQHLSDSVSPLQPCVKNPENIDLFSLVTKTIQTHWIDFHLWQKYALWKMEEEWISPNKSMQEDEVRIWRYTYRNPHRNWDLGMLEGSDFSTIDQASLFLVETADMMIGRLMGF